MGVKNIRTAISSTSQPVHTGFSAGDGAGEAGGKSVARSSVPGGGDSKNGLGGEDKSNKRYAGIQFTSFIQTITDE